MHWYVTKTFKICQRAYVTPDAASTENSVNVNLEHCSNIFRAMSLYITCSCIPLWWWWWRWWCCCCCGWSWLQATTPGWGPKFLSANNSSKVLIISGGGSDSWGVSGGEGAFGCLEPLREFDMLRTKSSMNLK